MAEVSRIFVKGLPPSFVEDDFRSHFSKRYNVTDVKLFAHRRIGYVGFKTPQDASAAVKYFNKTFIRMSRISVELADNNILRPQIAPPTSRKPKTDVLPPQVESDVGENSLKRKRDDAQKVVKNPKLDEFLGLMRPPSKLKTWQDEGIPGNLDSKSDQLPREVQNEKIEGIDHDILQPPITKKTKVAISKQPEPSITQDAIPNNNTLPERVQETPTGSLPSRDDQAEGQPDEQGPASDMDWMRSRTSRLLGLVEDDEEETQAGGVASGDESSKVEARVVSEDTSAVAPAVDPLPADQAATEQEADTENQTDEIRKSGRLYLRNLAYTISEEELRDQFSAWTSVQEVHVPIDPRTGKPKGFAFVQFGDLDHAVEAFGRLDGTVFQGRLLHIVPGAVKRESKLDDFTLSKLPLKKQRLIQRKADASQSTFNWNSMYMNADAVLSSTADRLGVSKSELLDPTASNAAVKQAQAETHIIQETKKYFEANGVDLNAFNSRDRGENPILVKNFTYGTKAEDLRKLFSEHGDISRVLMPPGGTIAIVEFKHAVAAKSAFKALAYKKLNDSMLFLEKAPKKLFKGQAPGEVEIVTDVASGQAAKPSTSDLLQKSADDEVVDVSTLYVSNISFTTSNERFREWAQPLSGFISAKIRMKPDAKNPGKSLSMGSGFLEFRSADQARAALIAMNGRNLDGHNLAIKPAKKAYDAAEERRKEDASKRNNLRKAKLIIKNLPFEVSKKDITDLFKPYGAQRVRVPKKFDSTRKGFAFVDFATPREAENAKDSMRDTHLLGRRLVIEYAAGDAEDPEKEIEKMQQKIGRQANNVAAQRLMVSSERRKFNIAGDEETESGL